MEVNAVVRAHAAALGANALLCYTTTPEESTSRTSRNQVCSPWCFCARMPPGRAAAYLPARIVHPPRMSTCSAPPPAPFSPPVCRIGLSYAECHWPRGGGRGGERPSRARRRRGSNRQKAQKRGAQTAKFDGINGIGAGRSRWLGRACARAGQWP